MLLNGVVYLDHCRWISRMAVGAGGLLMSRYASVHCPPDRACSADTGSLQK